MVGWPDAVTAHPSVRNMMRQGRRCEAMKRSRAATNANRKMVEDRGSFEKFVGGAKRLMMWSCTRVKSSILFCKSRMLRKKSLDSSLTGLTVAAGARGGPAALYPKEAVWEEKVVIVGGGGGCLAMNAGTRRARSMRRNGRTVMRYGSRQMNV